MALIRPDRASAALEPLDLLVEGVLMGLGREHEPFIGQAEPFLTRYGQALKGLAVLTEPIDETSTMFQGRFEIPPLPLSEVLCLFGEGLFQLIPEIGRAFRRHGRQAVSSPPYTLTREAVTDDRFSDTDAPDRVRWTRLCSISSRRLAAS